MPIIGQNGTWKTFQQHIDGFTVMPYRKIIVGIDHSSASAIVLQRAIQLAKAFSAKLIVVHVIATIHPLEKSRGPVIDPTYLEFMRAAGADVIASAKKRMEDAGVDGEVIEAEGIPAEEILAVMDERGADLIVVGSKEKVGSLAHLGSVSKAISERTKCSLLIERICEKC